MPQPIAAVLAYLTVEHFSPFLPVGFGIAASAMIWIVFAELIPDANENAISGTVAVVVTLSFAAILGFQYLVLKG